MSDDILPESKICSTCGKNLPLSEYHKNKKCKDGILARCKSCRKIADADYIEKHRDAGRNRAKKWREDNRERADRRAREWALKHPEKIKEHAARFRKTEHGVVSGREHVRNRRARINGAEGKLSKGLSEKLFKLQRGKCACCGKPLGLNFHLDHRMPLHLGGSNTDDNMQLLRPTCNLQKHAKHPVDFMQEKGFLL